MQAALANGYTVLELRTDLSAVGLHNRQPRLLLHVWGHDAGKPLFYEPGIDVFYVAIPIVDVEGAGALSFRSRLTARVYWTLDSRHIQPEQEEALRKVRLARRKANTHPSVIWTREMGQQWVQMGEASESKKQGTGKEAIEGLKREIRTKHRDSVMYAPDPVLCDLWHKRHEHPSQGGS